MSNVDFTPPVYLSRIKSHLSGCGLSSDDVNVVVNNAIQYALHTDFSNPAVFFSSRESIELEYIGKKKVIPLFSIYVRLANVLPNRYEVSVGVICIDAAIGNASILINDISIF